MLEQPTDTFSTWGVELSPAHEQSHYGLTTVIINYVARRQRGGATAHIYLANKWTLPSHWFPSQTLHYLPCNEASSGKVQSDQHFC